MKMLNYLEHTTCVNYMNNTLTGFSYLVLKVGDILEDQCKPVHHIVFVLEGKAEAQCGGSKRIYVRKNEVIFLPKSSSFFLLATEITDILYFSFENNLQFCDKYSFQNLQTYTKKMKYSFNAISMVPNLQQFASLLVSYLKDGINCGHLQEIKQTELFILFRAYYTKRILASFFHPIIGTDIDFKNKVFDYSLKAKSAMELAQMMGYAMREFRKIFTENFGETVYQWMLNQKTQNIQYQLMASDNDMKTIAFQLGFSSLSHFSQFCVKRFGIPPTVLKKKLRNEQIRK